MNILLVTPPLTQLNTPYPATTVLKPYLEQKCGHRATQCDLSIELVNRIFCREFITKLFDKAFNSDRLSFRAKSVASRRWDYEKSIDAVWSFLQGKDDTLATRIASRQFLPEGGRFRKIKDDNIDWAFGTTGIVDLAKHIATLYIEDLADFISDIAAPQFELVRYGEQISIAAPTFDGIEKELGREHNIIDQLMLDLLDEKLQGADHQLLCFTIPFPGTLLGALQCAKYAKERYGVTVAFGGGYLNTELRSLRDPRIFKYVDYMLYDDGEIPLERLTQFLEGKVEKSELVRTKYLSEDGEVVDSGKYGVNPSFEELPTPDFSDLDLSKYISLIELTNPMHKLWSDGKWNKMTVAHGCYWAQCTFCDTSLDYICRYDAPSAATVVDRMEQIMAQTKSSGFHFTDEALPPKLLKEIAQEIIDRRITVSFWGNVRFEKSFTPEMCELLAEAGCIAVSGGIEVANERVLKLIKKGITVESARKSCRAFAEAGIMVHAYLMYGFPSQSGAECVRSLDIVREWFAEGILHSAFWHRYAMTLHSPTGINPEKFGAEITSPTDNPFGNNGVEFTDNREVDWDAIGDGLRRATFNYMHGVGYDLPLKNWIPIF